MARNVFALLNSENKLRVHILNLKYGKFDIWSSYNFVNVSQFYKILCGTAHNFRSNLWINVCNPIASTFWKDPWVFDIPLILTPTYINMDLYIESFKYFRFCPGKCFEI